MTDRKREPLPEGYQFAPWRRPSDTAAEQLARKGMTANVIEGDHFDTDRDHGDETPPVRQRTLRRRAS